MTTVTGTPKDVAGGSDASVWTFYSSLREGSDGDSIITPKRVRVTPEDDGTFSVELDPGFVVVDYDGLTYAVTVPDTGPVSIWDLIASAVAFPPGTSSAAVAAAVNAFLTANPPSAAWGAITGMPDSVAAVPDFLDSVVNVKTHGAVGDGVTDDSAAFLAAYTEAVTGAINTFSPVYRSIHEVFIPEGTYRITGNAKMIADLAIGSTSGVRFQGGGMDATMIVFEPSAANGYLCDNQNDLLHLTFRDMSFYCTGTNASTASWMRSYSTAAAQNYSFDRVKWDGTWKYGIDLTGTDSNSDCSWRTCEIFGDWTSFLHAGAASTSDNFVNYHFDSCDVWQDSGHFIDLAKGGNVNVWGGSLIHVGDAGEGDSSDQTFFRLGVGGGASHSSGVERLLVSGVRVEHRHENSKLIQCGWTAGNVTFLSCDTGAFAPILANPNNVTQAEFGGEGSPFPVIQFIGSALMGKHEYHFDGGSYLNRSQIEYQGCNVLTHAYAADFLTITNDDATNLLAGTPPIKFRNCRGNGSTQVEQFDCTVGWPAALNTVVTPQVLSLKHPWGGGPIDGAATISANLPLGAIVTRVRAWKPASGADTSTTFAYVLKDATPTTLVTIAPGTAWNAGWTYDSGLIHYHCDSTTKRQLTLESDDITNEFGSDIYFLVEYLA